MSTQTLLKVHGVVYLTALTFVRRSEAKSGADEVAMWVATEVCDRGEVRPEITILSSALPVPATPIFEVC